MKALLPADKVHAACVAQIAHIDFVRKDKAEKILLDRMAKPALLWTTTFPFLSYSTPSRAQAIKLLTYPFSDYRAISMDYWNCYDACEQMRDLAAKVMAGYPYGTVAVTAEDFRMFKATYE